MLGKLFNLSAGAGSNGASNGGYLSASPEPVSTLESVQEDVHTRNLLYPEPRALFQHRHDQVSPLPTSPNLPIGTLGSSFDIDSDLDLDRRDIRVLILQDGLGSTIPSCVLYDSNSPPPPSAPILPDRPSTVAGLSHMNLGAGGGTPDSPRRVPTSPRKPSLGAGHNRPSILQPDSSPQLRQNATFERRPPLHSRSQSRLETEAQRAYREYTDEVSVYLNCVFGNSELIAYRGTSTKVHVLPSEPARPDMSSAVFHDGRGSLGRSSMRSSKLSQSFSSESAAMFPPNPASSSSSVATNPARSADRKRVLISRLFPVPLANDEDTTAPNTAPTSAPVTPHSRVSEESASPSYPFPVYNDDGPSRQHKKKAQSKQKRTPMYAIALIVSLPQPPPPVAQASSIRTPTFRGPGSYPDQDSCSSSYGSSRKVAFNGLGIDVSTPDSSAPTAVSSSILSGSTDFEERMDPITQRWDVIMRTFNQMQNVVTTTVTGLLRAVDAASPPGPQPPSMPVQVSRNTSFSGRRSEDGGLGGGFPSKPAKASAKLVALSPNALLDMDRIDQQAEIARLRISVGLRALRVVTGQNRWGIWRDEARWVTRWAATVRDQQLRPPPAVVKLPLSVQQQQQYRQQQQLQDDFLYSLLTTFLATHTDWLQALSPRRYRKRHMLLQNTQGNDSLLPARTVIVSSDKAVARRIIFLLATFLPMSQSLGNVRAHRPSTSISWGALSQSPPASFFQSNAKEESLRRKINRRTGGSRHRSSHTRTLSLQGPASTGLSQRSASTSEVGAPAHLVHLDMHKSYHERRPSDTASIRTANLPFSGSDFTTHKSSAATSTTIASDTTIPHFATMQRSESMVSRPDSVGSSAAADDLMRTLKRGDSSASQYSLVLQQQQLQQPGSGPASPTMRPDSRSSGSGSLWGNMLTNLLTGRRRDTPSLGRFGGHSRSSSASSWDPRIRRTSLTPSSPTKLRRGLNEIQPFPPQQPQEERGAHEEVRPAAQAAPAQKASIQQVPLQGQQSKQVADENLTPPTAMAQDVPHKHATAEAGASDEGIDLHTPRISQYSSPSLANVALPLAANKSSSQAPDLNSMIGSPVKMSVNAEDGVIDVEFPFPEYMRSFETAVSSPSSSGFLPGPGFGGGLDGLEQSFRSSIDSDMPANVAGWLQTFHPDFAIQAVPPETGNLLDKIKDSLRMEPSPSAFAFGAEQDGRQLPSERWIDVSSAIMVDASKLTITRVRYSRLVRPRIVVPSSPTDGNGSRVPNVAAPTMPSLHEVQIDEKFVEEQITSVDSSLTRAVERVIAQVVAGGAGTGGISIQKPASSGASADGLSSSLGLNNSINSANSALSTNSSRSPSVQRDRSNSASAGSDDPRLPRLQLAPTVSTPPFSPVLPVALEEVPRSECKTVLLSALKHIVRDVVKTKEAGASAKGEEGGQEDEQQTPQQHQQQQKVPPEPSILRGAVKTWVDKVDKGEL